ncbi:MAG: hypothetical protein AAB425_08115, partial [Bdellovibrionota bacterium]
IRDGMTELLLAGRKSNVAGFGFSTFSLLDPPLGTEDDRIQALLGVRTWITDIFKKGATYKFNVLEILSQQAQLTRSLRDHAGMKQKRRPLV